MFLTSCTKIHQGEVRPLRVFLPANPAHVKPSNHDDGDAYDTDYNDDDDRSRTHTQYILKYL